MKESCIIIPAIKKNVAFPDDLVKKLNGISLIQRGINKAKNKYNSKDIFLVTDSEEITLIGERNGINCYYRKDLRLKSVDVINELKFFILKIYKRYENIIILWPYTPLLSESTLQNAYNEFLLKDCDVLITLKEESQRLYREKNRSLQNLILDEHREKFFSELKSFVIFKSSLISSKSLSNSKIQPFLLSEDEVEIRSYQDWWICEKLLRKKIIIFRIIGHKDVGMGHIYRSLSLAHEISDHEIIFVCDDKSRLAVEKIAGYDYRIEVAARNEIEEKILSLNPDLVINDILDTSKNYILKLKSNNIKVVSFEDIGSGSKYTDLTINELYDSPRENGRNIRWGHRYFFVRDEFNDARPHKFKTKINSLLIAFGGTDPNNLTFKILNKVVDFCEKENITIHIVTGGGYPYKEELIGYLQGINYKKINYTNATGVISKIMEKTQIAISSNGRTVYELTHMNIPSIVLSQHERESTHLFSIEENGLINTGIYKDGESEGVVLESLERLVYETEYRKRLFNSMKKFNFSRNKSRVVKMISKLL